MYVRFTYRVSVKWERSFPRMEKKSKRTKKSYIIFEVFARVNELLKIAV